MSKPDLVFKSSKNSNKSSKFEISIRKIDVQCNLRLTRSFGKLNVFQFIELIEYRSFTSIVSPRDASSKEKIIIILI